MIEVPTIQTLFDHVARHLLTQRKWSHLPPNHPAPPCSAYRGTGGRSCAIGCLIEDDQYSPGFERLKYVQSPEIERTVEQSIGRNPTTLERKLLVNLQALHDGFHPHHWPKELGAIATRHGLDGSIVEQFK